MSDTILRDMLAFPPWVGANALLIAAGWRWGGVGAGEDVIRRTAQCLIICYATICGAAIALGALGFLSGLTLTTAVALLSIVWLVAARGRAGQIASAGTERNGPAEPIWMASWLAVLGFLAARVVSLGILSLPTDFDSLMYHLPLVDQWLRAGSFFVPACSHWTCPGNGEVLALWAVAPFSGDFFFALGNLIPTLLLATSAAGLCSTLGIQRSTGHLVGFATVANMVVLNESIDAKNDLAVAALFLTCLDHGFRYARGSGTSLGLGAASFGLLVGIKFYALGYAAVAFVAAASSACVARGRGAALRLVGVWALGGLAWGAYWYARNLIVAGNPLYLMGLTTTKGAIALIYPSFWESTFLGNPQPGLAGLALDAVWKMAGPCTWAAVVAAPATTAWLAASGLMTAGRPGRPEGASGWQRRSPWLGRGPSSW